jgi:hypothetical protein
MLAVGRDDHEAERLEIRKGAPNAARIAFETGDDGELIVARADARHAKAALSARMNKSDPDGRTGSLNPCASVGVVKCSSRASGAK